MISGVESQQMGSLESFFQVLSGTLGWNGKRKTFSSVERDKGNKLRGISQLPGRGALCQILMGFAYRASGTDGRMYHTTRRPFRTR